MVAVTGIERLRGYARRMDELHVWPGCAKLLEIADQIEEELEDEQCGDVETVRADAYEALEWVRERGGLDYVKAEWRSRVPYDRHEKTRQRLLDHIAECETALRRRNVRIEELGRRVGDLATENAELRKRAMPEGCEWPRYEGGESVMFGGFAADAFGTALDEPIFSVELFENGFTLHGDGVQAFYGYEERVRRPAVLAADGEPLEVGQTVWHEDGTELKVLGFGDKEDGETIVRVEYVDGPTDWSEVRSLSLTHTKPEPPDTWERVEEDALSFVEDNAGIPHDQDQMERDMLAILRRCKALAERGE